MGDDAAATGSLLGATVGVMTGACPQASPVPNSNRQNQRKRFILIITGCGRESYTNILANFGQEFVANDALANGNMQSCDDAWAAGADFVLHFHRFQD